ncbi:MAG: ribosome assembly RNA-binding protein YhbY [Gammaproteobacteria bacterium]|nr:ribosome assembly RNA-binding protein YhbY [Gammaproteobacteria bacterium]
MTLSDRQKKHLRTLGHHLKPVVWIGQHGLTDAVLGEIGIALDAHELIKIKIAADRDSRRRIAERIVAETGAARVNAIGQMLVLFRRNVDQPKVALPSA